MTTARNIEIANTLLEGIGTGRDPEEIAAACAKDLIFEVQGDDGVLPWIGRHTGRQAMADFIENQRAMIEPLAFDVEDVLASEERAVVVGSLRSKLKATGKTAATQFVLILTIVDGVIARFQMLEDSYGISQAAQP